MFEAWIPLAILAAGAVVLGLYLLSRPSKSMPMIYENPREERLSRGLARVVGCTPAQALPAVRRELELAPSQSDETLLKRAAYHYRQDLPEAPCQVYQDPVRG
jgi:hypothetical protein